MSADGDTVRAALWYAAADPHCTTPAFKRDPALAALARLEAAADEAQFQGEITKALMPYQERAVVAETQRDALAQALRMQGWDIGETQLCWCPHGWWDREQETGAEQTEHSTGCKMARAALAEAGLE